MQNFLKEFVWHEVLLAIGMFCGMFIILYAAFESVYGYANDYRTVFLAIALLSTAWAGFLSYAMARLYVFNDTFIDLSEDSETLLRHALKRAEDDNTNIIMVFVDENDDGTVEKIQEVLRGER